MSKYIFGSGLVGLLARKLLGPSYTIIPFYKSRFFTFNPPLDDNFIICNDNIDYIIKNVFSNLRKFVYRRRYSFEGNILSYNKNVCENFVYKVFGYDIPGQVIPYLSKSTVFGDPSTNDFEVYDLRCNNIYAELMQEYKEEIERGLALGPVTYLNKEIVELGGKKLEYSQIVNTIPLNAFCDLAKTPQNLKAKPVSFLHIETESLNFEGCNQLLVADAGLAFYKVTNVAKNRYLFYFIEEVFNPGIYLMPIIPGPFDVLDGTRVDNYIPLGQLPSNNFSNVVHVGSYAEWDWCVDIGSCILRLAKIKS